MFYQLSKNAFVRHYGDFVYYFNNLYRSDRMFQYAQIFAEKIGRIPILEEEILHHIHTVYEKTPMDELQRDFRDFITVLADEHFVLAGRTVEEMLATEQDFSYSMASPKTERDSKAMPREEAAELSQKILGEYFEEHPTLFSLQLDITQACTERCVHCYVPEYNALFLPFEKIKEVVDDFVAMGGLQISLSGGECMLHPDFERIVEYIRAKDCTCSILSNLTLCDDSKVNLLKRLDCSVQVSLYSMDSAIHDAITQRFGSHFKTKNAIERLYRANVPVVISCPTMRMNYDGYVKVMEYAESMKMRAQTDFIMMAKADHDQSNLVNRLTLEQTRCLLEAIILRDLPVEREYFNPKYKKDMQTPEERAERPLCGAGKDKMCLNADGNYYACSGFQDYPLGNCYRQRLREVWENSPQIKYLRGLRGKDIPKCIHCQNRNYCSMCLVRNFNETGNMLQVAEHFCRVAEINHQVVDELHERIRHSQGI